MPQFLQHLVFALSRNPFVWLSVWQATLSRSSFAAKRLGRLDTLTWSFWYDVFFPHCQEGGGPAGLGLTLESLQPSETLGEGMWHL